MSSHIAKLAGPWGLAKYYLHDYFHEHGDPRTVNQYWLVSRGLLHSCVIVSLYLVFCTLLGPRLMSKRAAFNLRPYLLVYNFSMSFANLIFFYNSLVDSNLGLKILDFKRPGTTDTSPGVMWLISMRYAYVISKYLDLFDTVAFVLTKKNSHLTFLHLYHHSSVALLASLCLGLFPACHPLFIFIVCNSFCHTLMYSYYGLSLLGPGVRRFLWWKRYLTQLQIIQFLVYIVYFTIFLFRQEGYPNFLLAVGYSQAPLFTYLFVQFYRRAYLTKPIRAKDMTNSDKLE